VELTPGQVLMDVTAQPRFVYFPEGGLIALLGDTHEGRSVALVHTGSEGMIGISTLLLGEAAVARAVVQIPAPACRVRATLLRAELNRGGTLQPVLLRYGYTLFRQMAVSMTCVALHAMPQRLARWLLEAHDRVGDAAIEITQEKIADLLAVQRGGISELAANWQDDGFIRVRHGRIRVIDRPQLEALACECYAMNRAEVAGLDEALNRPIARART